MTDPSPDTLASALAQQGLELPDAQAVLLTRYCELLWEWNEKINLTRHTDYEKFVARDLTDSLAIAQFLGHDEKILDVGTGGERGALAHVPLENGSALHRVRQAGHGDVDRHRLASHA